MSEENSSTSPNIEEWIKSSSQDNSEETKKLLIELHTTINEAELVLSILKPLSWNAEIYSTLFEKIEKSVNQSFEEIEKSHDEIRKSKALNTSTKNDLEKSISRVGQIKTDLDSKIIELKTSIVELKELEQKAIKNSDSITSIKSDTTKIKNEIKIVKDGALKLAKSLSSLNDEASRIIKTLRDWKIESEQIIKFLKEVNKQWKENTTELQGILVKWKKLLNQIDVKSKDVNILEGESRKKAGLISEYFEKVIDWIPGSKRKSIKDEIEETRRTIFSQQKRIDELLVDVSSWRLSHAFEKKEIELKEELEVWRKRIVHYAFYIVIMHVFLKLKILKDGLDINQDFWSELFFISPFLILFWFAVLEHSRLKKIYDEYSFKFISARTMPGFFELIDNRDKEKSIDFMIDTVKDIYANPSNKINTESKSSYIDYWIEAWNYFTGFFKKWDFKIPEIELEWKIWGIPIKIWK